MKLFDIPIKFHWSTVFLLLILMPTFTLLGLAKGLIIFVPVIIFLIGHELAHALMARKYGLRTRDITVSALGGVAMIQLANNLPPKQDIWISLAGPLFNIFWVIVFGALMLLATHLGWVALVAPLTILFTVNMLLGVFNLIPGNPLDGGRVTEALCKMRWGNVRGKEYAKYISFFSGALMFFVGLMLGGPILVLFGGFIVGYAILR